MNLRSQLALAGMGKELVGRWYGAFGEDYEKAEAKLR